MKSSYSNRMRFWSTIVTLALFVGLAATVGVVLMSANPNGLAALAIVPR